MVVADRQQANVAGVHRLDEILRQVERPGDFQASGSIEMVLPRLEVKGVGEIAFPLQPEQGKLLSRVAEPAPYGRGAATIVDPAVRKVRQVSPDRFTLSGRGFQKALDALLEELRHKLGYGCVRVRAQLYKLLVYDRGSFFVSHRDTEKADGMFATLVIGLPSRCTGGELVVRHAGRELTLNLAPAEPGHVAYAAFYADCEHEVRPVASGQRLALIYNLVATGEASRPTPPEPEPTVQQAAAILQAWATGEYEPRKLIIPLEHQYTPAGLSRDALKNRDAAVVDVLAAASVRSACAAHLAMISIQETGSAELTGYYRRGRYRGPGIDESYQIIEMHDRRQTIRHWQPITGETVALGRVPFEDEELCPPGALEKEPPDKDRVSEATGNEGATYERSYRRAAVVLWPLSRRTEIIASAGPVAGVRALRAALRARREGTGTAADALALARAVVYAWPPESSSRYRTSLRPDREPPRAAMLRLLSRVRDPALLERFIETVILPGYDGAENEALARACLRLPPERAATTLARLVAARMHDCPSACVELLVGLTHAFNGEGMESHLAICRSVARAIVSGLVSEPSPESARRWVRPEHLDGAPLAMLLEALETLGEEALLGEVVGRFLGNPERFPRATVLLAAVLALGKAGTARMGKPWMIDLWRGVTTFLLDRSEYPPMPPTDWAQAVDLGCHCEDCGRLQMFLREPTQTVSRFKVAKDRRRHLHAQLDHHKCDVTHVTERTGNPQTLVCTKNRSSHEARLEQRARDVLFLRELARLADGLGGEVALLAARAAEALRNKLPGA